MLHTYTELRPFGLEIRALNQNQSLGCLDDLRLKELFREHKLLLFRGFKPLVLASELVTFCERFGPISLWPFGKVLELVEHKKPTDHIFHYHHVPLHWDGMYRAEMPEYLVFQCLKTPAQEHGGQTVFSDTERVIKRASPDELSLWAELKGTYSRKTELYQSKTLAPLLCKHPLRPAKILRFGESPAVTDRIFLNHPRITWEGGEIAADGEIIRSVSQALRHPEVYYSHIWREGDIIVADNLSLLHGREAYTSGSGRHLRRVHVHGTPALRNPYLVHNLRG